MWRREKRNDGKEKSELIKKKKKIKENVKNGKLEDGKKRMKNEGRKCKDERVKK